MPKPTVGPDDTAPEEDHLASMWQTVKAGNAVVSTPTMTAVLTDLSPEEEDHLNKFLLARRKRLVEMHIIHELPWVAPEDVDRLREATGLKPLPPVDDGATSGARHAEEVPADNRRKRRAAEHEARRRRGGREPVDVTLLCRHGAGFGEIPVSS